MQAISDRPSGENINPPALVKSSPVENPPTPIHVCVSKIPNDTEPRNPSLLTARKRPSGEKVPNRHAEKPPPKLWITSPLAVVTAKQAWPYPPTKKYPSG